MRIFIVMMLFSMVALGESNTADSVVVPLLNTARDSVHAAVREIRLIGNLRTNDVTILRELTFKLGDSITTHEINESQQRVYNLGLFNSVLVTTSMDSVRGLLDVYITVTERWYIWPQILIGVGDRDWAHVFSKESKIFGGLGILHSNVRGRHERLFFGGVLGFDPHASLEYSAFALNESRRLLLDATLSTSRTLNKSDTQYTNGYSFNELRYNMASQLTYRLTQRLNVALRAEIQTLHLSNPDARLTLNPSGTDLAPIVTVLAIYDSRDNTEYTLDGTYLQMSIAKTGGGEFINFGRSLFDLREFVPVIAGISLCARAATNLAFGGNIPVYNHLYLGLTERVRGEFATKREGEDFALGSIEARIPIFELRTVTWNGAPQWYPSQFTSGRFGMYASVFADAGTVWFRSDRLADKRWSSGIGGGLNLLGPYGLVLRIEYAWHGSINSGEWIFDFNTAF